MDISFTIIELIMMALLFVVAQQSEKKPNNMWRLLYVAPAFIAVIMVLFIGFDVHHTGIYVAAFVQICALFAEKVRTKRILAVCSVALIAVSFALITLSSNYHREAYYADFEKTFNTMKEHYVIDKEKGIDWDELYAKYKPLFKEVDKSQDFVKNYQVWQQFCGEFYDGHVGYRMSSDGLFRYAFCKSYGNDYGLSLARLSTGEFVAINVEGYDNSYSVDNKDKDDVGFYMVKKVFDCKDADKLTLKNAGIKNGTIITKWNGKPIDEYYDEIKYYMEQYPVRENEEFYLPMYVAGIGRDMDYGVTYVPGETYENVEGKEMTDAPVADITFIDESGEEKTITAPCLGSYMMRMYDTNKKLDDGVNITNLKWQKINDDTYIIRISEMAYDQETYSGTDFTEMTDKLRGEVEALKKEGVKNIVFDLRSNGGGSPYFVEGIACLFAPKGEHLTYYSAVINEDTATFERGEDGKYIMGTPSSYVGEDLWHDGNIILLVNAKTVSAGDDMTYMMGDFPNVKVIGLTSSNSSCQAVKVLALNEGEISFSAVPNLLPNGEIAIDTYTDHVGRTPFDEKIPFDENVIESIFDKGEDYLLNYTVNAF
ncbi:MAG: hypothetical protein K6G76_00875 [Lachnospiraceae bacterium]|nr:hypothetical protein [Lachnospiraceae bacterium]